MIAFVRKPIFIKPLSILITVCFLLLSIKTNANGKVVLPAGTGISLETISFIQSDNIFPGQLIKFRVKQDVKIDGIVLVQAGSLATGQVVRVEKAKGLGKGGFIEIQPRSVTAVDGQEVFISGGNIYQTGDDNQTLALVLGLVLCIFFLAIKGKNAIIPPGYQLGAFVATNTSISVQDSKKSVQIEDQTSNFISDLLSSDIEILKTPDGDIECRRTSPENRKVLLSYGGDAFGIHRQVENILSQLMTIYKQGSLDTSYLSVIDRLDVSITKLNSNVPNLNTQLYKNESMFYRSVIEAKKEE